MHWMLLPLKRYAEFSGRSRRKEYWFFFLGVMLFYLAMIVLMMVLVGGALFSALQGGGSADPASVAPVLGQGMFAILIGMAIVLAWFALLVPSIAVGVRRLHDIDRSGWWLMLGYGPWILGIVLAPALSETLADILSLGSMLGWIAVLVMAVLPGTQGTNRFGSDPKGEDLSEVFA
ncbi:MAG: DUF805 domain-containing protein [Allosphingosinicella sp.]